MTRQKRTIRPRLLASALAVSLCLTGVVGCSQGENSDVPTSADTTEVDATEGENTLDAAHAAYEKSVEENLRVPLAAIAAKEPKVERTAEFINTLDLDPKLVNDNLAALRTELEQYETKDKSAEATLNEIDTAAKQIQSVILEPLISEGSAPGELFAGAPDSESGKNAIIVIQDELLELEVPAADWEFGGQYGSTTFGEIDKFIAEKNTTISTALASLDNQIVLDDGDEGMNPFLIAFSLFGITGLSAAGVLGYYLNRKGFFDSRRSETDFVQRQKRRKEAAQNHQNSGEVSLNGQRVQELEQELDDLYAENAKWANDYKQLENSIRQKDAEIKRLNKLLDQTSTQDNAYGNASARAGSTTQSRQRNKQSPTAVRQNTTQLGADNYNQNPDAFTKVATVALSKKSQEDLWVGKNVTPVFSPLSQGDYWVVTTDNQKFYLVVKRNALLNANNLKTLKIIYNFADQANLSSLKRQYKSLAKVEKQAGKDWVLAQRGELLFYP